MQVDLYNGRKMVVVVVTFTFKPNSTVFSVY